MRRFVRLGIWTSAFVALPMVAWAEDPDAALLRTRDALGIDALEADLARPVPLRDRSGKLAIERRGLRLHGVAVRGAWQTTRGGEVTGARYPEFAPQHLPGDARLDDASARISAQRAARPGQDLRIADAELVYLLHLGHPLLAWEVRLPLSLASPGPSRKIVWVSALTGRILLEEEQADFANEASVFRFNPHHTPVPEMVTLPNLIVGGGFTPGPDTPVELTMYGERVEVLNCSAEPTVEILDWWSEGDCFPQHKVFADSQGDFLHVPVPDVALVSTNRDPEDLYPEVSMYYHGEKFLDFMATRGLDGFHCDRSVMLANFHFTEPAPLYPELDYGPFNNASFIGSRCEGEGGPTMLFGQGSEVDFGYDGDVVYHEMGHGVVAQLTPEGLRSWKLRSDGVLRDARGINEAIADYHSLMITQDAALADYVGFYWPAFEDPFIRSANNENRCPTNYAGQEHRDSEAFTAALWAARTRVGERMDAVVLEAMTSMPRDVTMEEATALVLEAIDARISADQEDWTPRERETVLRGFEDRGLVDCPRIVREDLELAGRTWYLRQNHEAVTPFWPGPVQLEHEIPAGSDNFILTFDIVPRGNSAGQINEAEVPTTVLVKRAAGGIEFEYELISLEPDADEVTEVSGDWDVEIEPTVVGQTRRQVIMRGLQPGERVSLTLVNLSYDTQSVASDITVISVPSEELDGGNPGGPNGPQGEGGSGDERVEGSGGSSSCACRTRADDGPVGVGLLALGLLGLLRTRRRP